jgi:hypothetical protein
MVLVTMPDVSDYNNTEGIIISCSRKDCLYTWRYKGHAIFFACCPRCRRNNRIPRNMNMDKEEPLQHEQVETIKFTSTNGYVDSIGTMHLVGELLNRGQEPEKLESQI